MIWFVIPVALLILAWVRVPIQGQRRRDGDLDRDVPDGLLGVGLVAGCLALMAVIGATISCTISGAMLQPQLDEVDRNTAIAVARYDAVRETILRYVDAYPAEEKLLTSFDPKVLLKLPEIKSDVFLSEQCKLAVSYQTTIYDYELERSRILRVRAVLGQRVWVPCLAPLGGGEPAGGSDERL